jgi:Uncharacterized protein conserved in bacteria (DUF2334)
MRYVILRDDDTNALTPIECLEQLYRPFLERGLPVNLAVIPNVSTRTRQVDGSPEGYLMNMSSSERGPVAIGSNRELVGYLRDNAGFHVVQHGFQHDWFEFDSAKREEMECRLESGTRLLLEAGFRRPRAFVAPYDRFSRASLLAAAKRFSIVSTGWYELRRLPFAWWPRYLLKRLTGEAHWQAHGTTLLTHPGCLLSFRRPRAGMLDEVKRAIQARRLTVLVTHWWEYFPKGHPDGEFIRQLHRTAEYLAGDLEVRVIRFGDLVGNTWPLN